MSDVGDVGDVSDPTTVTAVAPGRVNLIGEYTDLGGGLVLPMAIDRATTVTGIPGGDAVVLRSDAEPEPAIVPLDVDDPAAVTPGWARYVAGVVAEVRPTTGFDGTVTSTVPLGAGLSSSAALEVAVALALGFEGTPTQLAEACQRAEQRASGVPCGIMDQLASAAGVDGHALLIDTHRRTVRPVRMPRGTEVRVVHSGEFRELADSPYADRKAELAAAERSVGPLRLVEDPTALATIEDEVVRRRARHVVTENARVRAALAALIDGDVATLGHLLGESHRSLRDDLEVSTPGLDQLVDGLAATPGVHGARLTGAGFGGCAVALCEPGALDIGWRVHPAAGAHRLA